MLHRTVHVQELDNSPVLAAHSSLRAHWIWGTGVRVNTTQLQVYLCFLGVVLEHPGALLCPLPLGLFLAELGLQEVHLRLYHGKRAGTRR
jgi:hypothetical protein